MTTCRMLLEILFAFLSTLAQKHRQVSRTKCSWMTTTIQTVRNVNVTATKFSTVMTLPGPAFQNVLGQPSYNTSHTMKPSDPLLLADVTLRCGMYPAGKVDISRHLAIPRFPQSDHTVSKPSADCFTNFELRNFTYLSMTDWKQVSWISELVKPYVVKSSK